MKPQIFPATPLLFSLQGGNFLFRFFFPCQKKNGPNREGARNVFLFSFVIKDCGLREIEINRTFWRCQVAARSPGSGIIMSKNGGEMMINENH